MWHPKVTGQRMTGKVGWARGPKYRLLSGSAGEQLPPVPAQSPDHYARLGWLYAVQVRSCIGHGKLWQAECQRPCRSPRFRP